MKASKTETYEGELHEGKGFYYVNNGKTLTNLDSIIYKTVDDFVGEKVKVTISIEIEKQ